MRLTKENVRRLSLPAGKSELLVFDDALPGFGIRLRAGGKRTWICQYRIGRQQRRVTIGPVERIDAEKARQAAKSTLAKAHLGTDAQAEKIAARARAAVTLGAVVETYLAAYAERRKERSLIETQRYLRGAWKPLHGHALHAIDRRMVAARLAAIASSSGQVSANRARAALSAFFSWCIGEGIADSNPVIGTNRAPEQSRDRVLTDAELRAVWKAAEEIGAPFGRAIQLLILTGQRRAEVLEAEWNEFDLEQNTWVIPRSRAKNDIAHTVALSAEAVAIVKDLPRIAPPDTPDGESPPPRYLFTTTGTTPFSGVSKALERLNERAAKQMPKGQTLHVWRLHDLRRTFASGCARLGVPVHVIERTLNHVSGTFGGIVGVYQKHEFMEERRQAMEAWAAFVTALVTGDSAKVVPLKRAAE